MSAVQMQRIAVGALSRGVASLSLYFIVSLTLVVPKLPVPWNTAAPHYLRVAERVQVLASETVL